MLFGAGGVIFPPFVGPAVGTEWVKSFFFYYLADIGPALLAVFALLRTDRPDRVEGVVSRPGPTPGKATMMAVIVLTRLPPVLPGTCAAACSPTVARVVTEGGSKLPVALFYFGLTAAPAPWESSFVERPGKRPTPVLVAAPLLMIFPGALHPVGVIDSLPKINAVVRTGVISG
jgi:LIVCS family branched-chain amino acid:cation transporter